MLKRKFAFWRFQANHLDAMARYLERQASKGWFMDCKASELLSVITFRRGTPKKLKYSAVIIPSVSEWDQDTDSRVVEYRQLCEEYGWSFVGSYLKYKIFSNENMDAAPIETDPDLWFETVGRELLTKTVPSYLILCFLFFFQCRSFFREPAWNLVNSDVVAATAAQAVMGLVVICILAGSVFWYMVTRRRLKKGREIRPVSLKTVQAGNLFYLAGFLLLVLSLFGGGESLSRFLFGFVGLLVAIVAILLSGVLHWAVKKHFVDSGGSGAVSFGVLFFITFLILMVGFGTVAANVSPDALNRRAISGEEGVHLPVEVKSLGYVWEDDFFGRSESSVLASVEGGRYARMDGSTVQYSVSISYYTANYPWVYQLIYEDMKADYGNAYEVSGPETSHQGGITVDYYLYEIDEPDVWSHYIYVMQKGNSILKLDFNRQDDPGLVFHVMEQLEQKTEEK